MHAILCSIAFFIGFWAGYSFARRAAANRIKRNERCDCGAPLPIGHVIKINKYNISECEEMLKTLTDEDNYSKLTGYMKQHPIQLTFPCGWTFTYAGYEEDKLKELIRVLAEKIDKYKEEHK